MKLIPWLWLAKKTVNLRWSTADKQGCDSNALVRAYPQGLVHLLCPPQLSLRQLYFPTSCDT